MGIWHVSTMVLIFKAPGLSLIYQENHHIRSKVLPHMDRLLYYILLTPINSQGHSDNAQRLQYTGLILPCVIYALLHLVTVCPGPP